jgi:hypothetical protein
VSAQKAVPPHSSWSCPRITRATTKAVPDKPCHRIFITTKDGTHE